MSEPLDEACETSWLQYLNRFDTEIYPVLFAPRGISQDVAHLLWSNNVVGQNLQELIDLIKERNAL